MATQRDEHGEMPTQVSGQLSWFDRFADAASRFASRAWFFAFCVVLVVLWAPSILLFKTVDTWQLVINTLTTIVTFLLVALLQNTQKRSDDAIQQKLNAIAGALASVMKQANVGSEAGSDELRRDRQNLLAAVGLENRESS